MADITIHFNNRISESRTLANNEMGGRMKVVNIMLEDKEHERLEGLKRGRTWKQCLKQGCEK